MGKRTRGRPKGSRGSAAILDSAQALKVLQTARRIDRSSYRLQVALLLSFELGLRASEISRLCVADIYEGNGNVANSVRITSSGSERLLPIRSTRLRSALANHFEYSFRNRHIDNATPVIRSQRGGAMTTGGLARLLTHLYRIAEIESGSSRSGRRTLRAHLENFGFTRT
jgi:integrase